MVTVASSGRPRESGFEYTVSIVVCTSVISRQNRQGRTAANNATGVGLERQAAGGEVFLDEPRGLLQGLGDLRLVRSRWG
jgi:hypothetical protein